MIGFVCVLLITLLAQGLGRSSDFEVYYNAGRGLWDLGWAGVYVPDFVTPFKYHPAVALFFVPFAWLPWLAAKWLWVVVNIFCLCDVQRLLAKHFKLRPGAYAWAFLFVLHALTWQWKFANVTFLMLWLFLYVVVGSGWQQGLAFALLLALKPTWLVLLPAFVLARHWRGLALSGAWLVGLSLLPFLAGFEAGATAYEAWWATLVHPVHDHNFPKNDNQCWYAILYRHRELLSPLTLKLLWLGVSVPLGLLWLKYAQDFRLACLAVIPLWLWLGPMSWIHHQILLLPLFALLIAQWQNTRQRSLAMSLGAAWLLLNGTGEGLLGRELFVRVYQWGLPVLAFPLLLWATKFLLKFVGSRQNAHT